jgi:hypothetical protein
VGLLKSKIPKNPQPPALGIHSEWAFHEPKLDALTVKLGTADRPAQLLEICGRVDATAVFW